MAEVGDLIQLILHKAFDGSEEFERPEGTEEPEGFIDITFFTYSACVFIGITSPAIVFINANFGTRNIPNHNSISISIAFNNDGSRAGSSRACAGDGVSIISSR